MRSLNGADNHQRARRRWQRDGVVDNGSADARLLQSLLLMDWLTDWLTTIIWRKVASVSKLTAPRPVGRDYDDMPIIATDRPTDRPTAQFSCVLDASDETQGRRQRARFTPERQQRTERERERERWGLVCGWTGKQRATQSYENYRSATRRRSAKPDKRNAKSRYYAKS